MNRFFLIMSLAVAVFLFSNAYQYWQQQMTNNKNIEIIQEDIDFKTQELLTMDKYQEFSLLPIKESVRLLEQYLDKNYLWMGIVSNLKISGDFNDVNKGVKSISFDIQVSNILHKEDIYRVLNIVERLQVVIPVQLTSMVLYKDVFQIKGNIFGL